MTKEDLRRIRKELGLYQSDMAKAMGITDSLYKKLEQGQREVQAYHVKLVECVRKEMK